MNRIDSIPVGFLEGTKITCQTPIGEETEANVETLRSGDMVKTLNNGFMPVRMSSFITLTTPYSDDYGCLYQMSVAENPNLLADLCLASHHCTLVRSIPDASQKEYNLTPENFVRRSLDTISDELRLQIIKKTGAYNLADGMNKIPAFLDTRFTIRQQTQDLNVWYFSLEAETDDQTYGIHANGILVESVSLRQFRKVGFSPLGLEKYSG